MTNSSGIDGTRRRGSKRRFSFHIVALDVERAAVVEAVTRFLGKHAGWSVVP